MARRLLRVRGRHRTHLRGGSDLPCAVEPLRNEMDRLASALGITGVPIPTEMSNYYLTLAMKQAMMSEVRDGVYDSIPHWNDAPERNADEVVKTFRKVAADLREK